MKEVRKKEERGRGEVSLGRGALVALVAGLARLVRPLVDTVVVTAGALAPRAVGRTAEGLAVHRAVVHTGRGETRVDVLGATNTPSEAIHVGVPALDIPVIAVAGGVPDRPALFEAGPRVCIS